MGTCLHDHQVNLPSSSSSSSFDQMVDLSRLLIDSLIGFGAKSRVYHGWYNGQEVAMKRIMAPLNGSGTSHAQYWRREVALHSRLNHPNIVRYVGAFNQNNEVFCILTEYLSGRCLRMYLKNNSIQALSFSKVVTFALDIARGMEYLHSQGIIHRDLKPENILVEEEGGTLRMKIADFGISCMELGKNIDGLCDVDGSNHGKTNAIVGSYRWMAPEMIRGEVYGRKVDVYSFGLLMSELVSGRVPFHGLGPEQVAHAVINKNLRPNLPHDCPSPMRALIEWCWASRHKDRPEFSEIVKVLEQFESSLPHVELSIVVSARVGSNTKCSVRREFYIYKIFKLGCVHLRSCFAS